MQLAAGRGHVLWSALLTVDQHHHIRYLKAGVAQRFDCAQHAAAAGHQILDDGNPLTWRKRTLDELARAVALGFLARVDQRPISRQRDRRSNGQRGIGHCRQPVELQRLQQCGIGGRDLAQQRRIAGNAPQIKIYRRLLPRCQRELTKLHAAGVVEGENQGGGGGKGRKGGKRRRRIRAAFRFPHPVDGGAQIAGGGANIVGVDD